MARLTMSPVWQVFRGGQSKWIFTKYSIWLLLQSFVNLCIIVYVFYVLRHVTPPIGNHFVYYGTVDYSMDKGRKTLTTENRLNELRLERARKMLQEGDLSRFKEKAIEIAERLGIVDFNASDGWLQKCKHRFGIQFKTEQGEAGAVDVMSLVEWQQQVLLDDLAKFDPNDVFNADETGLFWQLLPNKTMAFKGDKCAGGKKSKERITVLVGANMSGTEKLPLLVIGKSTKPRCFKKARIPVEYKANKKAWMTGDLFETWLKDLDKQMKKEDRHILLYLDNCSSHNAKAVLSNVTVKFLPPNTTSKSQIATSSHRLTIGILASRRHNHELTQLIGHLSSFLTDNYRLVICNVEYNSSRPQEITHFEQFLEVININSRPTASKGFKVYNNRIAKEAQDYWKCLNQTSKWGSDYVLLLEDDALPVPEFNTAINSVMLQLDKIKQVDYVKLFHPWRLRGIPSLFQTAVVVAFHAYFLQLLLWRDRNLFVILLVSISGHIVIRMHFREIFADVQFFITQSAQLSKAESCCTQAVIFRGSKINEMVTELGSEKAALKHAKDHILEESRFEGRATDANFVVHIGYYSYLRQKKVRTGN